MATAAVNHPATLAAGPADVSVETWQMPEHSTPPPERAAEIIRQVEYYFSDVNLPQDAHMLGLTGGDGNGPVSLSQIMSFRKMKPFRPKTAVREALRQSKDVEITRDNQHVKRRYPLMVPIRVKPEVNVARVKKAENLAKGLTKKMLEPTGFETNATQGPISPEQHQQDCDRYSTDLSFPDRLENLVNDFNNRRKMHQDTRAIFEKFVIFGGLECNTRAFQGGASKEDMKKQGLDKEEIAMLTAYYGVSEQVKEALWAADDGDLDKALWEVDFETVAKAFLSSEFMECFDWHNPAQIKTACLVLYNFYQYAIYHSAFPDHDADIKAAQAACILAENELPKLAFVDQALPGDFNAACSTLMRGYYADIHRSAASAASAGQAGDDDWTNVGDNMGLSVEQATTIFKLGIAAHGTEQQYLQAAAAVNGGDAITTVSEEQLGLEIVRVELPTQEVTSFYSEAKDRFFENDKRYVLPMGKLVCKRWEIPFQPQSDLPHHVVEARKAAAAVNNEFEFLIEEETLKRCVPGMKLDAVVKELSLGVKWIDRVEKVYPTFFFALLNDRVREWHEPGPPKPWMMRQNMQRLAKSGTLDSDVTRGSGADAGEGKGGMADGDYSDEEPE
ncbi:argonaute-binding protein 1-like [Teratosphaeria destructans]|uniref:Argonaute-binding protein 1-like n=1 Tax=Teratosphaeria destructans TaxID=418781 RepID=A0A9W7SSS7_9PEZI|nr:argonaute-binding protein 1-like [Teratosphaeria destructans]